jgi:chaperonin GroES
MRKDEPISFRPLHDRVVIRRLEALTKSAGGILIPDNVQEKPAEGLVIACGPGARNERGEIIEMNVKKGDTVLFGKWTGSEVVIDGEKLLIMPESDILGIKE